MGYLYLPLSVVRLDCYQENELKMTVHAHVDTISEEQLEQDDDSPTTEPRQVAKGFTLGALPMYPKINREDTSGKAEKLMTMKLQNAMQLLVDSDESCEDHISSGPEIIQGFT